MNTQTTLKLRDQVTNSTGKTTIYGTADYLKGYEDGRKSLGCMEGRAQFDNLIQKHDYTEGYSLGSFVAMWESQRGMTDEQMERWAERDTLKAIARDYGYSDDAIEALDSINIAVGQQFPTEG